MKPHQDSVDELQEQSTFDKNSVSLNTYVPGSEAEKKLLRRIDLRIVPTIWVLYTLSYLDRANIGNARTGGMQADLGFNDTQYSVILVVFFISYVIFEVPSNMILTRVRPRFYLSALCILWGGVAACMAACTSWQQVAGVRFALGVAEAGFAPGVAFYLSSWYRRHELARRYAIYYTATAVSGAFSGLLAGVIIQHLDGKRGYAGWQWLLLIEGVGSSFAGFFTWMILPDWPSTTKWITPEEKLLLAQRLAADDIGSTQDEGEHTQSHMQAIMACLKEWRVLALALLYMLATGSQTIQYFIPALVGQLGYTGFHLQYMTIPIYAVALIGIITFCFISDFRKERGNYITIAASMACVSFIICVAQQHKKVQYAFLCFAVAGIYAACPLTLMWVPNIISHPAEKRAIAIAVVNGLGNSASIYGSFLWPRKTAPRYVTGFVTTIVFVTLLAVGAQVLRYFVNKYPYRQINARRASYDNEKATA